MCKTVNGGCELWPRKKQYERSKSMFRIVLFFHKLYSTVSETFILSYYQDFFFFLTHRRQNFSRVEIGQKRQQRCFSRVLRKYDIEIWRLFRRDKNCHDKTCPRILSQTIVLLLTGPYKARTERPRMENCLRMIKCGWQPAHGKMQMIKWGWYYGW